MLAHVLLPEYDVCLSVPHLFWKHLLHTINIPDSSQPLHLGGMITRLAVKLGWANEDTTRYSNCFLDEEYLKANNFISVGPNNTYSWIVGDESIPFPITDIPPLVPDQDHFMFPQFLPPDWIHPNALHTQPLAGGDSAFIAQMLEQLRLGQQ